MNLARLETFAVEARRELMRAVEDKIRFALASESPVRRQSPQAVADLEKAIKSESEGVIVEQVIRPTGLLDPEITVVPSTHQIDHLLEEIRRQVERGERTLVTTLTKRMAEELNDYLAKLDIKTAYIHSDVETMDRIKILDDLRAGIYDVLIGVNLLREGLDLPEVSLVAILDADKEGFLRSHRSLTQTVGRAARNLNGRVIMYADHITESMQRTIDETHRRREHEQQIHGERPPAQQRDIRAHRYKDQYVGQ